MAERTGAVPRMTGEDDAEFGAVADVSALSERSANAGTIGMVTNAPRITNHHQPSDVSRLLLLKHERQKDPGQRTMVSNH